MNGRRLLFSFRAFCFCKSFADGAKLLENALQSHSVNSILQLKVGEFCSVRVFVVVFAVVCHSIRLE